LEPVAELDQELRNHEGFWLEWNEMPEVRANEVASRFTEKDWESVDAIWRERPTEWKKCFAKVLETVGPPPAGGWLVEMITDGEDSLALLATESFRELRKEGKRLPDLPPPAIDRIRRLWRAQYRFSETQLEELLGDLKK